ncbi:MAG: HAD-IA family hydrolase [Chlamydiae bacterium]|nr:HAD-IA family hydrolase [Chlamydiota bacterium]
MYQHFLQSFAFLFIFFNFVTLHPDEVKAILFDLDGVLVNSRVLHFETFRDALEEIKPGYNLTWSQHEAEFDGLSTRSKIDKLISKGVIQLVQTDFLYDKKQTLTLERLPYFVSPRQSLNALLDNLKNKGYRLFCCSNSIRSTLIETLKLLNIQTYFEEIYSNQDVIHPKPASDIYNLAMMRAGLEPKNCLIIEDSLPGRKAAYGSNAHVLEVEDAEDVTLPLIDKAISDIKEKKSVGDRFLMDGKPVTFHVVIPMAGEGLRFRNNGYKVPKPFIPVGGKKMIEWVIQNMLPKEILTSQMKIKFHLIVRESHMIYGIESLFDSLPGNVSYTIHPIQKLTEGAACSVLHAESEINNDDPLIIVNSDQFLEWKPDEFYKCLLNPFYDGVILTFYQPDPRDLKWSYAKISDDFIVTEVQEKKWIGPNATVGLYGWKRGSDFVKYSKQMIAKNIRTNNEFYVCPVYNELIQDKKIIRTKLCKGMWGLGVPEDLEKFRKDYLKEIR